MCKKIEKTVFQEAVEINNAQKVDNEQIDTSKNNIPESSSNQDGTENEHELIDLAKILANLIKDKIQATFNVNEQDLCAHDETSNTNNTCDIDVESNRIKCKYVSNNVLHLSRRSITDDELNL